MQPSSPNASIPADFDWVRARNNCSLPAIFKELHNGVMADVEALESVSVPGAPSKFSVTGLVRSRFSVVRVDGSFSESVTFVLASGVIAVLNDENKAMISATITLNDKGECKLKVESDELYQWQFRRMALEKLFFDPH